VPWALVRAQPGAALPARPPWTADGFRFPDFTAFRAAVQMCMGCLVDAAAYGAVAAAIFDGLRAQNVRYAELSFDIVRALDRGLVVADVGGRDARGRAGGAGASGLRRVLAAQGRADAARRRRHGARRAGPGRRQPARRRDGAADGRFRRRLAEARRRGLAPKAHAGELAGPPSVATALDRLGVRRIEHGVRAIEDDALVARLAAEAITLDVCPWSNVRLRVVPDLARHPIRRLHERGVRVTLNTDDPTVFGRSLTEELVSLVDDLGFSPTEAARLQANAFAVAAMPAAARAAVLDEIDALVREVEVGKA
jgi:adenosine deaminase